MKRSIVSVLATTLLIVPAYAVDLTVDQTAPIMAADGKTQKRECQEVSPDKSKCLSWLDMTVGSIVQEVLQVNIPQDATNAKAGSLAVRAYGKDKMVFKLDESTMILARVDKLMDPIAIARMHEVLEPQEGSKP